MRVLQKAASTEESNRQETRERPALAKLQKPRRTVFRTAAYASRSPHPRPERNEMPAFVPEMLRQALHDYAGRIAVVSSFGVNSALMLSLVAEIDPHVLFLETGQHFAETLAYRHELAAMLGLTDVRDIRPDAAALSDRDPNDILLVDPSSNFRLSLERKPGLLYSEATGANDSF